LRISLRQYENERPRLTPASRRWAYFFLVISLFIATPFFRGVFRNEELTSKKVTKVRLLQVELTKIEEAIKIQINPDTAKYVDAINNNLLNLISDHNELQRQYKKVQISKEQVKILNLRKKPSWLQSGLTLCIENCLEMVNRFSKKYLTSSTAQVSLMMGSPPQPTTSHQTYSSSAPVHPFNPASAEGHKYNNLHYPQPEGAPSSMAYKA
jgi:hypothetical protein